MDGDFSVSEHLGTIGPELAVRFRELVYAYYTTHKRSFPWRENVTPYRVFISEIMLQQTQAPRVISKFNAFIERFPNFETLAGAAVAEVLGAWQGLGYNRRAVALRNAAIVVVREHTGSLPDSIEALDALPGIGYATACSISAFAFNKPVVFIETNIRTVYLHHFFRGQTGVSDAQLIPLVDATLDRNDPREWYSALMDYGTMLKKAHGNASQRSKHYAKQSAFKGSDREIRGMIVKQLVERTSLDIGQFHNHFVDEKRITNIIFRLRDEGIITIQDGRMMLRAL